MTDRAAKPVYVWISGQRTNIGDSLLRRPYLRVLWDIGPVDVWVPRPAPRQFVVGLGAERAQRLGSGFAGWYARTILTALRQPTVVALNAGPAPLGRSAVLFAYALALACRIARVRGGSSMWLGAAVPATYPRRLKRAYRTLAKSVDLVTWRESGSIEMAGEYPVYPDWAFAEGSPSSEWPSWRRDFATVVMRGDRPYPDQEWIYWIRSLVEKLGLRPVVVVQVREDTDRARKLADHIGARLLEWREDADHVQQEARIREVYQKSVFTVGDRFHGLVIAATEGSVPLGWVPTSNGKIATHFAAVGLDWVGAHEGADFASRPALDADAIAKLAISLRDAVDQARSELARLSVQARDI